MPLDPTVVMALAGAVLTIGGIAAGLAYLAVRALKRRAAHRRDVAAFLTALKAEAAWAVACEFPLFGVDVLQMLVDHRLIGPAEPDALIAAAAERERREMAAEARERRESPLAPTIGRPAFADAPDDEIPF
jgi:hypothetical protein